MSTASDSQTAPPDAPCRLCGGAAQPRIRRAPDALTGDTFRIQACAACGLAWTEPVPADLGRHYGPHYHGRRHGLSLRFCLWRRRRLLAREMPGPGRLLDVGCGDGAFLRSLLERGWTGAGVELGSVAETLRNDGLDVRERAEAFQSEARFDAITLWHSLEHVPDPVALLEHLRPLLKPDGLLLVAVPDAEGLQACLFGPHWLHLDVPRHLWHFGRMSLDRLLLRTGFQPRRHAHQELEFDVFGWVQSLFNACTPEPNAFFHALTGKPRRLGGAGLLAQGLMALLLLPFALAATALGTLLHRGGTLLVAARPGPEDA